MSVPTQIVNPYSMEAAGTITQWACCVNDAEGKVVIGAATNDAGFAGVATHAANTNDKAVSLSNDGSLVPVIVGVTGISLKSELIMYGAAGRVGPVGTTSGTAYNVVGIAQEAGGAVADRIVMRQLTYIKRAQG